MPDLDGEGAQMPVKGLQIGGRRSRAEQALEWLTTTLRDLGVEEDDDRIL